MIITTYCRRRNSGGQSSWYLFYPLLYSRNKFTALTNRYDPYRVAFTSCHSERKRKYRIYSLFCPLPYILVPSTTPYIPYLSLKLSVSYDRESCWRIYISLTSSHTAFRSAIIYSLSGTEPMGGINVRGNAHFRLPFDKMSRGSTVLSWSASTTWQTPMMDGTCVLCFTSLYKNVQSSTIDMAPEFLVKLFCRRGSLARRSLHTRL